MESQAMRDQFAIITGASSGIGAATALRLSTSYRGLVLHAGTSKDSLERVAERAKANGCEVVTHLGDLTEPDFGTALVECARSAFGQLDVVIANAGFPILKALDEGGPEDLDRAFRGNVFSFFSLARAAAPHLVRSSAGRIVAVGSFTAHVFRTDMLLVPFSATSKGALETAVRSLAMHFGPSNVTVNCVVPGWIAKDQGTRDGVSPEEFAETLARIPLGRSGQPDDVAAAIEFLAGRNAGYITGQLLHVNGGLCMA
jgi:3-oxoacyl-[acyl-carrier protein] reductase